jgi:very-short-patch-repair endonuclease
MFNSTQIVFLLIGCTASIMLLYLMLYHRTSQKKSKTYHPKKVITQFESQMFFQLKQAFPEPRYHVLAQVAFTALITSTDIQVRNKFNRKVTDFVILNKKLEVMAIIELDDPSHLGREQQDAARDAMFHDAGYRVLRYTSIPSIRQLHKDLKG